MSRNFGRKSGQRVPQRGREAQHEQFGRQPKELVLCPSCQNVKFQKHWHSKKEGSGFENFRSQKGLLKRERCPACSMIANHTFEGELFLQGFPDKYRTELLNLIAAFGRRAEERDPQDRIIAVENAASGLRVTTTEDETAVKLARKIEDAYKTVDLSISYSSEPNEVSRVHLEYLTRPEMQPKKKMKMKK